MVMKPLQQNLLDYLQTLTGAHLDLVLEEASALPLFLRTRYDLCSLKLFGRRVLLALETLSLIHISEPTRPY